MQILDLTLEVEPKIFGVYRKLKGLAYRCYVSPTLFYILRKRRKLLEHIPVQLGPLGPLSLIVSGELREEAHYTSLDELLRTIRESEALDPDVLNLLNRSSTTRGTERH